MFEEIMELVNAFMLVVLVIGWLGIAMVLSGLAILIYRMIKLR